MHTKSRPIVLLLICIVTCIQHEHDKETIMISWLQRVTSLLENLLFYVCNTVM